MRVIRSQQFDEFSTRLLAAYVDRSMQRIRVSFPEYYYRVTEPEVRSFIEASISRASEYGLETESTVGRFLDYRLIFSGDFENAVQREWMLQVLRDPGQGESAKIYEIDMILFGYSLEPEPYAG